MVERFSEAVLQRRAWRWARSWRSRSPRRRRASCASGSAAGSPSWARTSTRARVDGAWIGTIHGFCARVLRTPAARGRPRSALHRARRGRRAAARGEAFERALDAWTAAHGAPALDLAAAYALGPRGADPRRARRAAQPRHGASAPARCRAAAARPTRRRCSRAAAPRPARALRAAPGNGARVTAALEALEACTRAARADGDAPPLPGALDAAKLPTRRQGARARRLRRLPRGVGRATAPRAPTTTPARSLVLLDALLDAFGTAYAAAKAARARRRLRGPRAARARPARGRRRRCAPAGPSASR